MKIRIYFFFIISTLVLQSIDAQTDTSKVQVIKQEAEQNVTQPSSTNQNLEAELKSLRQEVDKLKQAKTKENETVVIERSAKISTSNGIAKSRYTLINMNMTTMISRLVPFGNGIPLAGPTTLMLRRYRENRAFRLGIGLNASSDSENISSLIRIGTERKRDLNEKFTFIRGVDFMFGVGSFNTPGFRFGSNDAVALGADLSFGLEYKLNKYISISTETLLFGGLTSDNFDSGLSVKIIPPIAIYLNAKIN